MKFNNEKLAPIQLFWHYGETDDIYLIGGLVAYWHRLPSQPSYVTYVSMPVFDWFAILPCFFATALEIIKKHEPIQMSLYISDVRCNHLKQRNNYSTLRIKIKVTNLIDEAAIEAEGLVTPSIVPAQVKSSVINDFLIPVHNWDTNAIKSNCFDYCELHSAYHIKDNLGVGVGIIPLFHDPKAMTDFDDEHGLSLSINNALKSKLQAKELDMNRHMVSSDLHEVVNMSRLLQKLEHCNVRRELDRTA
jgi:hypothetical protein